MRVTRFTSFAATAGIFMTLTRLATGTDIDASWSTVGDGDDSLDNHHDEPFHGVVSEEVVMRLVEDDEGGGASANAEDDVPVKKHGGKYVTTDAVKYTTFALDDVKKSRVHDGAVHAESIGTSAAAAAVTHLVHRRRDAAAVTITQSCSSSNNISPLVTQQQFRLSPSLTPASTMMTTPTSTNANNITFFAAEAATTICTPISWTNTNAFTTDAACPSPYENGTYCGFTNPEDPCAIQPGVEPDTPEAFLAYAPFHEAALRTATPPGYRLTFVDLYAAAAAPPSHLAKQHRNTSTSSSADQPPCYMGFHLLPAYDPAACAALCESDPSGACAAFNLYAERGPAWNPWRCSCDTPLGVTNYKCALFSGAEAVADGGRATNFGQYMQEGGGFARRIAGSNGRSKETRTREMSAYNLKGKVAIVTGAGSGINHALTEFLLEAGCSVVMADLRLKPSAQQTLDKHPLHNAEPSAVFKPTAGSHIVVNGAGVFEPHSSTFWNPTLSGNDTTSLSPAAAAPEDDADAEVGLYKTFAINTIGPIRLAQIAVQYWLEHCEVEGNLLWFASMAGYIHGIITPLYFSSKAAVVSMCKSLGGLREVCGVRNACICPGTVHFELESCKSPMIDEDQKHLDVRPDDIGMTPKECAGIALRILQEPQYGDGNIVECFMAADAQGEQSIRMRDVPMERLYPVLDGSNISTLLAEPEKNFRRKLQETGMRDLLG
ncbi:hypothetical protein PG988_013945 [Apiospora saccharicola]